MTCSARQACDKYFQFMLVACRPFVPYTLIVRYVRFAEKNMTLEYRVKEFPKKDGFSSGYIYHIYMVSSAGKLNAAGQDTAGLVFTPTFLTDLERGARLFSHVF